jgi:molybdopterin molybdotransferase
MHHHWGVWTGEKGKSHFTFFSDAFWSVLDARHVLCVKSSQWLIKPEVVTLISVTRAVHTILRRISAVGPESIPLETAEGRVLYPKANGIKTPPWLGKGRRLSSQDIGFLSELGSRQVIVYRQPRVAILSTGDELVELGDKPKPGQIVNTNSYTLAASVIRAGGQPLFLKTVRDRKKELAEAFREGLRYDVMVSSGGVSVGDKDFVKDALQEIGLEMHFWKVAQRPGHPLAFGHLGSRPVFGLPGNPVSSMVGFILYVRPTILRMMGHRSVFPCLVQATLEETIQKGAGHRDFIRCVVQRRGGRFFVSRTGAQGSGILHSLSMANGLIVAREDKTLLKKGTFTDVLLFDENLLLMADPLQLSS